MTLAGGQYIFITNPRTEILYTIKEREKKKSRSSKQKGDTEGGGISSYIGAAKNKNSSKQDRMK